MLVRSLLLLSAVALVVASGCGDDDPTAGTPSTGARPADAVDLEGRTFVSTTVTGHDLVSGSTVSLAFQDARISARAGCNTMGSGYAVTGSTLEVDPNMMSTQMGCEPELMDQDQWLSQFLTAGPSISVEGDTMTLSSGAVTMVLVDESAATDAAPLVGTAWQLETIIDADAASSVPAGVETPTFQIGDDGFAAVFTGCNRGSTAVGLDGSTMSFGPMRLTKMACPGDAARVEAAVLGVLDGEATFELVGDQLTFTKGDRGLVYRAG